MAKRRDEYSKRLLIETLQFLIKQRNMALFRLNDCRSNGDRDQIATAENIVRNLRLRFTLEVDMNQHLLSDMEKKNYFRDNRKKKPGEDQHT